jgi:hypothetical protein
MTAAFDHGDQRRPLIQGDPWCLHIDDVDV